MTGNISQRHPGKVFIDVEDIADNLNEYQIFDTRYSLMCKDYGIDEYIKSHLPGAIFVDSDKYLTGPLTTTARHPLPDPNSFIEWCMSVGIGQEKPILCYDDECGGMGACRMWWMLHSLGVEAYVLNGGFQAYFISGFTMETGLPEEKKLLSTTNWKFGKTFKKALTIDEVPPNAFMVDARATERYSSTVRPYAVDILPGHIHNAVSLPWFINIVCKKDIKFLKPKEECCNNIIRILKDAWGEKEPDVSECVFYCGSGITATFNIAIVYHLGFGEPFLYCGSWSEYAGRFAFSISRRIVEEHGMIFKMISPSRSENPKVTLKNNNMIILNDEVMKDKDPEVEAAVTHMHFGEKAQVFFKSRRIAVIEVPSI